MDTSIYHVLCHYDDDDDEGPDFLFLFSFLLSFNFGPDLLFSWIDKFESNEKKMYV